MLTGTTSEDSADIKQQRKGARAAYKILLELDRQYGNCEEGEYARRQDEHTQHAVDAMGILDGFQIGFLSTLVEYIFICGDGPVDLDSWRPAASMTLQQIAAEQRRLDVVSEVRHD
jgi:hypothetical protein